MEEIIQTKKCSKCRAEKSLGNFWKRERGKFGVDSVCKECSNKIKKEYHKTEKGKNWLETYSKSEKRKRVYKKYRQSEKGKEAIKKWAKSEKTKQVSWNCRNKNYYHYWAVQT